MVKDHDQFEAIGTGMASVTYAIRFYAEFSALYLKGQSKVVGCLKSAVVKVYSLVLKFLSKAKRYYEGRKKNAFG